MLVEFIKKKLQPKKEPTSLTAQKETGNWAEALAAQALTKKGCKIIEKNWMHGTDEIDVIAKEDGVYVFVEVRARKSNARVPGAQTLNAAKRKALRRAAQAYLHTLNEEVGWRWDVVEVSYQDKKRYELYHYEGVTL